MAAQEEDVHDYEMEQRDSWSGRMTFWLAAVGAAVGLGNLWRFPWQLSNWGGGAFLFAYFVALFTLGMPLLTQELALGQKHRSGDIEAFGRMNWRLRGIGLASVIGAFGIVTYYMVIIGLSTVFFFESFKDPLPYDNDPTYFLEVVQIAGGIGDTQWIIAGKLYLATCFCWFLTFLCIMKGVSSASWAVKITMPLPFLLLCILMIKGFTLEGALGGLKQMFSYDDWSELQETGIWNAAIGQCFFSLSVCMGVMTAYGSYNPKTQDIATDEKVISLMDVSASLVSGLVVYSVLGYLTKTDPEGDWYSYGGAGLVFAAYPVAISSFDAPNFFGVIFYLTLLTLGIDSAFSIVEAIATVIADSDANVHKLKWSKMKIAAILCVAGAFGSSLYCFDVGLYWLDIIDHYINNYGMVFLGIMECGAMGWFYRYDVIDEKIGKASSTIYRAGFFTSLVLGVLFGFALSTPEEGDDGVYTFTGTLGADSWIVGFVIGMTCWIVTIIVTFVMRSEEAKNMSFGANLWYILGWENVEVLRSFMNGNGVGVQEWKDNRHTLWGEIYAGLHHKTIGIWWGFYVKYWIPVILSIVMVGTMRDNSWNSFLGFKKKYLVPGMLLFSLMVLCVVFVAVYPQSMAQSCDDGFVKKDDADESGYNEAVSRSPVGDEGTGVELQGGIQEENQDESDNPDTVGDDDNNDAHVD